MRPLIDPRLRSAIPQHWPSRCTIRTVTYTTSASNQRVPSGYEDVIGISNIQCRLTPFRLSRMEDDEQRGKDILETYKLRTLTLNGYFPSIMPESMQAVIDGIIFPIRGIEHDGQHQNTRLKLEIINPGAV